jgi:predicted O-methyltransferase YrrM
LLYAAEGEIMDWTKRINDLVGQDFYIHKDHKDVKNFIDYLYAPYEKSDRLLDSMEEVDTDIFFKYRKPLYDIAYYTGAKTILECGIREGRSGDAFTRVVSKRGGRVYSYDPVLLPETFVKGEFKKYWYYHEMTGEEGYKWNGDAEKDLDLLYIDVDPHYFEPTNSLLTGYWRNNVRQGGYIVLDDAAPQFDEAVAGKEYGGVWRPVRDYGVLRAILSFCDKNDDEVDYAFTVFNNQCNGFAVIKLK